MIRQRLSVSETAPLYCSLSDVTADAQYYHKAWELSNQRSARAMRGLAFHYLRATEVNIICCCCFCFWYCYNSQSVCCMCKLCHLLYYVMLCYVHVRRNVLAIFKILLEFLNNIFLTISTDNGWNTTS